MLCSFVPISNLMLGTEEQVLAESDSELVVAGRKGDCFS